MASIQRIFLILFAIFAAITAFFQLRSSMKSGQMQNGKACENDVNKMSKMARIFAVLSAISIVICIIIGALSVN